MVFFVFSFLDIFFVVIIFIVIDFAVFCEIRGGANNRLSKTGKGYGANKTA